MSGDVIGAIRASSENLKNSILRSVTVDGKSRLVEIAVVTDRVFSPSDLQNAKLSVKPYVPEFFRYDLNIVKLTPDCDMVKAKIREVLNEKFKAIAATLKEDDVFVEKTDGGFSYTVAVMPFMLSGADICPQITAYLKSCFCGEFSGKCVGSGTTAADIEVEEEPDEPDFQIPVRRFKIEGFEFLEGEKIQTTATYIADLNFAASEVVICGTIEDLRERTYTNKNGVEKAYLTLSVSDTTATAYATYFIRQKTAEKIRSLKIGDSVVLTGVNEEYKGNLRYTAKFIDIGRIPSGFVPEKRASKPVPLAYHTVKPIPFSDIEQTDIFTEKVLPDCLKNNTFVVFDLETTGLNSSPTSGNMDKIIEIGAYKIEGGEISQCFSTFINPQRKLSDEIVRLTGISESMVENAPVCEDVMPDFFKFCHGSILVGHNILGFDFKFVDYYLSRLGYNLERKVIDTIPLSQELLFLSNYKLNTVADKFNITFNHHRATDDALATAKIFIELIKMKKSLPKM